MRERLREIVDSWEKTNSRGELEEKVGRGSFTGVVEAESESISVVNGRVVGADRDAERVTEASTAFEAPDPTIPLLHAMKRTEQSERATYFTNETPLERADEKLADSDFVGYVELSEDVLSGDYYAVYYGGEVFYAGILGDDEVLLGDEAKDRAMSEVGVYRVYSSSPTVTDVEAGGNSIEEEPPNNDRHTQTSESSTTETRDMETASSDGDVSSGKRREPSGQSDAHTGQRDVSTETNHGVADMVDANETGIRNIQRQLAQITERIEELEQTQRKLQRQVEGGETGTGEESVNSDREEWSRRETLKKTDAFVRYDSHEGATIEDALEDPELREDVRENRQTEIHTRFDPEQVAVDGEPFDQFIDQTLELQFVEWLVSDLPYELDAANDAEKLLDLVDVIPQIDRVDFGGEVEVAGDAAPFDLVLRDQRGRPLLVADATDTHDPVTEPDCARLFEKAAEVAQEYESLGAATYVASSFYESGALEVADSETKGGILSSKRAYAKVNRSSKFHFCLVEGRRESEFHLTHPDL